MFAEGPNGVTPTTSWWWLAVALPHSSTPFDLARTIGTSLAVLGAMLLLDRLVARSAPTRVLPDPEHRPDPARGRRVDDPDLLRPARRGHPARPDSDPWVLFLVQVVAALAVGAPVAAARRAWAAGDRRGEAGQCPW